MTNREPRDRGRAAIRGGQPHRCVLSQNSPNSKDGAEGTASQGTNPFVHSYIQNTMVASATQIAYRRTASLLRRVAISNGSNGAQKSNVSWIAALRGEVG